MDFISQTDDVEIYGVKVLLPKLAKLEEGTAYEVIPNTFNVGWNVEVETRSWGIKSIIPSVENLTGSFELQMLDEMGDVSDSEVVMFDLDDFTGEVEVDITPNHYGTLSIDSIEIDFERNVVKVS